MSSSGRGVSGPYSAAGNGYEQRTGENGHGSTHHGAGGSGPGSARKKRRRQRSQRGKRRHAPETRGPQIDTVSRERIFQDLEGLLRQIREQAEEFGNVPEERISEYAHTVVSFTKSIEEQSDPISERSRVEYQRIREKLSQALRG